MNALARYFSGAKKTAQNQPWLFGIYLVGYVTTNS